MDAASVILRAARPEDVGDVLRLVRGLADYERLLHEVTASGQHFMAALFAPCPRAHAVLAWVDGEPVGFALWYYTFSTFAGGPDLFLEDIFVEPAHRGTGIGRALFRRLAQIARTENCRRMEWRVLNWNEPSIEFYRRLGARPMRDWTVMQLDGPAFHALAA